MAANHQFTFSINAPVTSIYTFLKGMVIINILLLAGTWLSASQLLFPDIITLQWYLSELNFAKENVVAAWYSSMLFFCTGMAAAICFWADMQRDGAGKMRVLHYGWLVMACIFITLSFDEMGSFHEMISQTGMFKKAGGGNGKIVFFGLIGAVAIFMFTFFISKFKTNRLALALTIIGVLLFISNPFQEKFEIHSWRSSADPDNWRRPIGFLLLEEGSEIFASFCFLFSFVTYAIQAAPGINDKGERVLQLKSGASRSIVFWVGAIVALIAVLMLVIEMNAWEIPGDDDGLPQDWPPAAIFFASFVMAVYLLHKENLAAYKKMYKAIAATALIASAYFGSYMYGYWQGPFAIFRYLFLGIVIGTAILSIFKLKDSFTRLLLAGWVGFMTGCFFRKEFSSALYGYAGGACLLLALLWQYYSDAKRPLSK